MEINGSTTDKKRNMKRVFKVSVERFAFLTGRSLLAFKRDFKAIFNNTPTHWLMKKRLQEAFLSLKRKSKNRQTFIWN